MMFLVPKAGITDARYHDPYTESGARSIIRRFNDDVGAMLRHMLNMEAQYDDGRTMLSNSPLARKIWVAAALKTMQYIEEHETRGGACALTLTQRGRTLADQMEML